jgi:hypothetical protein
LNCDQTFDTIRIEGMHLFAYVQRIRELAPRKAAQQAGC